MKKLAIVLLVTVASFCLAASAFAGSVAPGASAKCNNASTIKIEQLVQETLKTVVVLMVFSGNHLISQRYHLH